MSQVNEIAIVEVDGWWRVSGGLGLLASGNGYPTAKDAKNAAVKELGGEWEQIETHCALLQRYRRKPPPSEAERVARECAREVFRRIGSSNTIGGVSESGFTEIFAPLIATVNAAEVSSLHVHIGQIADIVKPREGETLVDAVRDLVDWNRIGGQYQELASDNAARVQELEAELDSPLARRSLESECARLRNRVADNDDFMAFLASELDKWKCGKPAAEVAPMFWPEKIACIVKERTKELEAQRDAYREARENLRDAVTKDHAAWVSILSYLQSTSREGSLWANKTLSRLEAALAEPEVSHVS